jgi:Tfp pilus assembly protein PilP
VQQVKPYSSAGKRDPFISPIQVATTGVGACTGGKRCLIINQITLRGIVKSVNGWIAVVENPAQKTYFLHENDAVLNGFVSRITGETVIFKENMVDALGQQSQRDIVKYVSAPVV